MPPCTPRAWTVTRPQDQALGSPWPACHAGAVIIRVLRAKVKANRVAAFDAISRKQVDLVRGQPGLEYVKLARRLQPDGGEEVVLFEEWLDSRSLYAWVGPNLAEPRLVPGARELMDELNVAHYEALDRDAPVEIDAEEPDMESAASGRAGETVPLGAPAAVPG